MVWFGRACPQFGPTLGKASRATVFSEWNYTLQNHDVGVWGTDEWCEYLEWWGWDAAKTPAFCSFLHFSACEETAAMLPHEGCLRWKWHSLRLGSFNYSGIYGEATPDLLLDLRRTCWDERRMRFFPACDKTGWCHIIISSYNIISIYTTI